ESNDQLLGMGEPGSRPGEPPIPGGVVEQTGARYLSIDDPSHDQHPAIGEKGCRVREASLRHWSRYGPAIALWIVDLSGTQGLELRAKPAGDEHAAVAENGGSLRRSAHTHARGDGPVACRRVVDLGFRRWRSVDARVPSDHQDASIFEHRR